MMLTKDVAYNNLKQYVGEELSYKAKQYGVTIIAEGGGLNKGWKGHTVERMAGLPNTSTKGSDGNDFELKSVPYHKKGRVWMPKETMAIGMINQQDLYNDDFYNSHLYDKMKSLLIAIVSYNGSHSITSILLDVVSISMLKYDRLTILMEHDYEMIREKLKSQGYDALTGSDGVYIQARTKGPKHSNTRAFYARKKLLQEICPCPI